MTKTMKTNYIHPKMKKLLTAMFALLLLAVPSVAAAMDVYVDDVQAGGAPLSVYAGGSLPVSVTYDVASNASDVVVEVELSYGHGKKTEMSTDPVDAFVGTFYKENLVLKLRDDVETLPSGETYTLTVTVKDGKGVTLESGTFDLALQRKNDVLEVQKVMLPSTLEAGKPAFMTVVLKNIGSDDQDDVYVKVTSSELGLNEEERAGDIAAQDDDEDEDTATLEIPLRISKDALEGTYTFKIKAYNDNVEVETSKTVFIKGVKKAADSTEVVPVVSSMSLKQGSSGVYKISLLNLGNAAQTYSVSVEGLDGWATYEVNPLKVTLSPDSNQLVDLALTVSDKALVGGHAFTVKVNSDGKEVRELTLTANIEKNTWKIDAMLVSVVVLALVLVVLVAVLVRSRSSGGETEAEESYY